MFDLALEKMGADRQAAAMLGDRLDTDIEGAHNAGLASILVLTGVTTRQVLAESPVHPDFVYEDLVALRLAWQAELQTY
jgi:4-nitrophenyl phosphatase